MKINDKIFKMATTINENKRFEQKYQQECLSAEICPCCGARTIWDDLTRKCSQCAYEKTIKRPDWATHP